MQIVPRCKPFASVSEVMGMHKQRQLLPMLAQGPVKKYPAKTSGEIVSKEGNACAALPSNSMPSS